MKSYDKHSKNRPTEKSRLSFFSVCALLQCDVGSISVIHSNTDALRKCGGTHQRNNGQVNGVEGGHNIFF